MRLHASILIPLLQAVVLCAAVSVSRAAVSNLGNANNGAFVFANDVTSGANRAGQDAANSFTTGSTAMSLDGITVSLAGGFGSGFTVSLFNDASGLPGTVVLTLTGNVAPTAGGLFTYTPTAPFTLSSSFTYWAVFTVPHTAPDKQFPVYTEASHTETGDAGWTIGDNYASRAVNNGSAGAWTAGPVVSPTTPLQFSVKTSTVPEPSTVWILAGGLAVLFVVLRRRRSAV